MDTKFSRILGVDTYFPPNSYSIAEVEERIISQSKPTLKLPVQAVQRLTGVERIFYRNEDQNASDLAVEAARKVINQTGVDANSVDLLIFASASQDLIEPATAHIVAQKLGLTCPVFDIKNACNSFLNGIQVADSLIKSGAYNTVLIVTGETPSVSIRWECETKEQFLESFAGFSMSDSGGAILLQSVDSEAEAGVLSVDMSANSEMWKVGILDTGGSRSPRDPNTSYFNIDGSALYHAFRNVGCALLFEKLATDELDWADFTKIGVHQVSTIYTKQLVNTLQVPTGKLVDTVKEYGNVASNSLPLQISTALQSGELKSGDKFAFIGLGGGISTGLGIFRI